MAAAALLTLAAAPAPFAGRWVTGDKVALVEVAPCGAALCGQIARVLKADPGKPTTDVNNPDKGLRSRPIAGLTILTGFVADGDHWSGRIYDPRSGRTYRSELRREGGTLKVKGCFGPFCRTQVWSQAR
jgi:uncharacterized protein (DUF2147 family)